MRIPFKKTYYDQIETDCVRDALSGTDYVHKAKTLLSKHFEGASIFLTTSGSAAFDLLFAGLNLPKGSEVILPSFTFPSAANTILRYGLTPVFADICEDTKTLDIDDVRKRMTANTMCVLPTHYGGASCDLNKLRTVCGNIPIIEDAALSFGASYDGKPLGMVGDMGIMSFHHTKNISADQGGLLLVDPRHTSLIEKLTMIADNGTDKAQFLRGQKAFYSWQTAGMNVQMPNINAAVLFAQLNKADEITNKQKKVWQYYYNHLSPLGDIALPHVPAYNHDNAHVFYIVLKDKQTREYLRKHLAKRGISAHFHYMPLHTSAMGQKLGWKPDDLPVTQSVSARMLRLPIYADMPMEDCEMVASAIKEAL